MADKKNADEQRRARCHKLAEGLARIHLIRDGIAKFLAQHGGTVDNLVRICDENGWEPTVAYDIREALASLGASLGALVLWDAEVVPADIAEDVAVETRRLEAAYAKIPL